ncbi:nitrite reductase small subunit NirD [Thalassovita sp.]|uniref:nitrite reductase small subunit NirD n=1 Tax=Thalassovita sp. TaxID=1979401 RepID=UPI002B2746E2|nr:nitrite reductase small subunit NirD [Thalassovita sp.]
MNWLDIGPIEQIPLHGARVVKTQQGCVAIFRPTDNEVFATADRCPHKGGPLSEGIVHGRSVTCPLHNWVFSLETGQAQGADDGTIETYATRIENGRIFLDVSRLKRQAA